MFVTISNIAKLVNDSKIKVTGVMNDRLCFSQITWEQVLEITVHLNFHPNQVARLFSVTMTGFCEQSVYDDNLTFLLMNIIGDEAKHDY